MVTIAFRIIATSFIVFCLIYPFLFQSTEQIEKNDEQLSTESIVIELPLHDVILPDFANIADVKKKKSAFFSLLKPYVKLENERISVERIALDNVLTSLELDMNPEQSDLEQVKKTLLRFKLNPIISEDNLLVALNRVDGLPLQLVLSQAANESGWGTSRFTRIGLNFFGQWCYKKGCGLVPRHRVEDGNHEVAAFKSIEQGVASYFLNVNTHPAYQQLRDLRQDNRNEESAILAQLLATGLSSYSERGDAYIEEISNMIVTNERYFSD